jgi:hypothetical protein
MAAFIIQQAASLATVLEENTRTRARLAAMPLTLPLAADFVAFEETWTKVNAQEIALRNGVISAYALVGYADEVIDVIVDAIANAVLIETHNDRKALLYTRYFGARSPNQLKRFVLGAELETVRGWIPSLKGSSVASLASLGNELEQAVLEADAAVKAVNVAEQQNQDFRILGERKALIDEANALRKSTHGKLSEMPHAFPELHLPNTFADRFFRAERRSKALDVAALKVQIADKGAELGALNDALAEALAEEEKAAKATADAEKEADQAALAEAEKEADQATAKVTAIKTKLGL